MRVDLITVEKWVKPNTSVLDIGCGDGELLDLLHHKKNTQGVGVEINEAKIQACLEKNVAIIDLDMVEALENFSENSFDVVIMTQTLQVTRDPHLVLDHALRIGKETIVAFPNFAHWRNRFYLSLIGKMPVSESLPFSWFDTPNIHFFTANDFEEYCRDQNIRVTDRCVLNNANKPSFLTKIIPNFFGSTAIYRIHRG